MHVTFEQCYINTRGQIKERSDDDKRGNIIFRNIIPMILGDRPHGHRFACENNMSKSIELVGGVI